MVLPGCDEAEAVHTAERLRAAVEKHPVDLPDVAIPVTLSLGVAACRGRDRLELEPLLRSADAALYQAKDAGRNRVVLAR